jgi:hypothetical protein
MTIAFVLGNGISRREVSLTTLEQCGPIYGCNALYREYAPTVLVATDRPIATHIQASGYSIKNKFYTRKPINGTGALRVPQEYYGFSSGPIATGLAAIAGHRRIYLVGFDMGPNENKQFNNLYAGTEFYKPKESTPTFTGNWIKQFCQVITDYPATTFYRIHGGTTAQIPEFNKLPNVETMELSSFITCITNHTGL